MSWFSRHDDQNNDETDDLSRIYIPFYELSEPVCRLGSGQFGRVYEGQHHGRTVVYKMMKHATVHRSMFLNEVRVLHSLRHPSIPSLIGFSISPPQHIFCIVMEKANGLTLHHCIYYFDIPLLKKLFIGRQLLELVRYLHTKKILYRDLKPANIMVCMSTHAIQLVDFGLAVELDDEVPFVRGVAGTMGYMAPEVREGKWYTFSADIFSYGMVLLFLFTESERFKPAVRQARLRRHVSSSMCSFILSCVRDDPLQRPYPVGALLEGYPDTMTRWQLWWIRVRRWFTTKLVLGCLEDSSLRRTETTTM